MTQGKRTELARSFRGHPLAALEHHTLITRGLAEIERADAEDLFQLGVEGFRLLLAIFGQDRVDPDWTAVRRAADQGHADAQYWLGVVYSEGAGVSKDSTEAAKWFRLSSDIRN